MLSGDGLESICIAPIMPTDLMHAEAVVDTWRGDISCRWIKQYDETHLYVGIPFGMTASIEVYGETRIIGSGFWHFEDDL